jgi:hypothetical protein
MADYDRTDRLIQLFHYELNHGRYSVLWEDPKSYALAAGHEGRDKWMAQKRAFTRDEVLQGQWVKIAYHGNRCIVQFHVGGTLTEADLFKPEDSWHGQWQLVGLVLRMNVGKYELDIVANKEGAIHSGIEFERGGFNPTAYFKVLHLV